MNKALLILEDGTIFHGTAAGKVGKAIGEICFNTGMTGYQEIYSDPSYFGQIMVSTNPHIGNYGTHSLDLESNQLQIAGLVCRNFTEMFSRFMADTDIQSYFEEQNMVAIGDVDTRAVVRHIRSKGAMNAMICSIPDVTESALLAELKDHPSMEGLELSSKVSCSEAYEYGNANGDFKVAVLDYGVKRNILNCLANEGLSLKVFPAKTSLETIMEWNPDGIFLSNGPGDPATMDYAIDLCKTVLTKQIPLFGICLGHQILCQSVGIPTFKMHNGHRGANHPVLNLESNLSEITSQNHGFGINQADTVAHSDRVKITHVNLNDETVEGIKIVDAPAFSVQYHPEASPGPHDSRYLFKQFKDLLQETLVK